MSKGGGKKLSGEGARGGRESTANVRLNAPRVIIGPARAPSFITDASQARKGNRFPPRQGERRAGVCLLIISGTRIHILRKVPEVNPAVVTRKCAAVEAELSGRPRGEDQPGMEIKKKKEKGLTS